MTKKIASTLPEGYTLLTGGTIVDADGYEHRLVSSNKIALQTTEGDKTFTAVFTAETNIDNTKIAVMINMLEAMKRDSQN